ncbi:MAG: alpha/beta fold hydrolase [Deltaproteobacteria bacterium]|nr:alpha/beta fold hydrolase [Deltaproteobacteria bacterium]
MTAEVVPVDERVEGDVRVRRVRYAGAGGIRVPAILWQPANATASAPAVVLQHGANTSKEDYYIQAPARRWAKHGWTVFAIDLAEHGERATATPGDPLVRRRLIGKPAFVEQSVGDLAAGIDVLTAAPGVDAARIGYVGFSLGGMLGTVFAAREPRIAAAAIVIAGSFAHTRYWERGATEEDRRRRLAAAEATDPAFFAAAIAPRPFLMVNTLDDPVFPRDAVETLFAAAREPKELRWRPGTHHQWGAGIYREVFDFLRATFEPPSA